MKRFWLLLLLICSFRGYAQTYGNEWIDYEQAYYKFEIITDGVYRIDYQTLIESGIPIQSIDPRNIQIFGREKEIPILIEGESDGVFDEDEVIEFLAFRNDGWLDSLVYQDADWLNNPYHSLYNDTLRYYLTWNDQTDNHRMNVNTQSEFDDYDDINYIWTESLKTYPNKYYGGSQLTEDVRSPFFNETEGWFSTFFGFPYGGLAREYNAYNPQLYLEADAPDAIISSVVASKNNASTSGDYNHHLKITMEGQLLIDTLYANYKLNKFRFEVDVNAIGDLITNIKHEVVNDLNLEADYQVLSWVKLRYPHKLRPNGNTAFYFDTPHGESSYQHLHMQNVTYGDGVIYTMGSASEKIIPQWENSEIDVAIPSTDLQDTRCVLIYPSDILHVSSLSSINNDGHFVDYGSMTPDSAFVIVTHESLMASANAYATYRSNMDRDAIVANVDGLYDQFGGGIVHHQIAIRRFSNYIWNTWASKPGHLFLLGKSIEFNLCRNNPENFANNLVPSFGFPPSDNLITSGLEQTLLEPLLPTGRISAIDEIQVADYLQKVMDFESQEPAEWMKHIMHFGGGANASEQALFSGYLNNYQQTISDTCFGAVTHTFLKNTTLPIEVNLSDSISDRIAAGTSIMTFFGHATGNSFDYSIDNPANLTWNQHYPLFIGNSCFTGNIHLPGQNSTSEEYTLIPDKGAIAFIASVNLGFSSGLNVYTHQLYKEVANLSYGKSIGEQIKNTIKHIQGDNPGDVVSSTALGMTLEGDPSLIINSFEKPDISIGSGDIIFNESELSILSDSMTVRVVLENIGKATNHPFEVELIRHFPSGQPDSIYTKVMNGLYNMDTLVYTIPLDFTHTIGLNVFDVFVDLPSNNLEELDDYENNTQSTSILISVGSVLPGYPYEFAIVGDENLTLKASTGDPFEIERNYRFEMDTIHQFNSGFLQSYEVSQSGGVLEWELPFELMDSTVYFWRVSVDSTITNEYQWNESSFQYIEDQEGWSQADFYQFEKNEFNQLIYDTSEEDLDFLSGVRELKCQVLGNSVSTQDGSQFTVDGELIEYSGCTATPALHVAVFDPQTLEAWETNFDGQNPDHLFGQLNQSGACRQRVERYFIFQQYVQSQLDSLHSMLDNKIPDGHYLLIYSYRFAVHEQWDVLAPWLYDKFDELGAEEVSDSEDYHPFIMMTKMGDPESTMVLVGDTVDSYLELYYDMQISGNSGRMRSSVIGPALSWDRLWWDSHGQESQDNDETHIKLRAINESGVEIEIPNADFDGDVTDEVDLLNYLNQEQMPYLKLESYFKDSITQTPAQIDAWHVNYGVAPDAAINPQLAFEFYGDTLQEGEQLRFFTAIENISPWDMDSLKVNYWVEDRNQQLIPIEYQRQDSLRVGAVLIDTIYFNTTGYRGSNKLWMEINPFDEEIGRYDQREQYHFNNIASLPFFVERDKENPILDVSFDGVHILDGELVSVKPDILITLDDENPYLLMDEPTDTTYFSIFLTDPDGVQNRLYFHDDEQYSLVFTPSNGTDNISKISYKPELTMDGKYNLLVIASDKSGNASGDINYDINFEVDHESKISDVMNYPNPFSTRTQFVFTLSGAVIPDYMRIDIMTVTGRIVKTIFKDELGNIRIGRNITDYAWDGRDEFGDILGNGVYLYKVTTRYHDEEIEHRQTEASHFFKKGFGKMYLMR